MSLKKSFKRIKKKVAAKAKDLGRHAQQYTSNVLKYAAPVIGGAVSLIAGPVVGGGVTTGLAASQRFLGATRAREKGIKGKAARTAGRELMQSGFKQGMMGVGLGTGAAGIIGAFGGVAGEGGVLGGLSGGLLNIFGVGGGGGGVDTMPTGLEEDSAYMAKMMEPGAQGAGFGNLSGGADGGGFLDDVWGFAKAAGAGALESIAGNTGGATDTADKSQKSPVKSPGGGGGGNIPPDETPGGMNPMVLAGLGVAAVVLLRKKKSA